MTHIQPLEPSLLLLILLPAGFALGLLYFEALRRTVKRITARDGWRGAIALTAGRVVALIAVLAVAARLGAMALLVTFAGFLLARTVALYRSRRT
jgi:NhaP-type Na+/H+ or K+/H+ antiporter